MAELQEEIAIVNQGTMTVTEIFTQLRTLWNELSLLRPMPRAKLECSYGGNNLLRYYDNFDHIVHFF